MSHTILRLSAVKGRTGLSRSTIYARIKQGTFPSPIRLGARAIGWVERDIDNFLDQLVSKARQGPGSASDVSSVSDAFNRRPHLAAE